MQVHVLAIVTRFVQIVSTLIRPLQEILRRASSSSHTTKMICIASLVALFICTQSHAPHYRRFQDQNLEASPLNYTFPFAIEKNATLYSELVNQGFSGQDVEHILKLSKPIFDLSKLPVGLRYRLIYSHNPVVSWGGIEFQISPTQLLTFSLNQERKWMVKQYHYKTQTRIVSFTGKVINSLWESARQAKMNPQLIAQLTDIFGYELDFSRQVTDSDSWRLTAEQHYIGSQIIGWGRILAAEYNNNSNTYSATYYEKPGRLRGYFDPNGQSLSRSFLRSPIEFARISSGFSKRRFHPKLKVFRPHLGVDYAAPTGTPVRALGDGLVLQANHTPSGGKTIALSHGSTYKTRYLHLSGFAAKIHPGTKVKQGQVIGYVGSTGLSTGPHLHFEFYENNHYVDPLKVSLPAGEGIPADLAADFNARSHLLLSQLPPLPRHIVQN